MPSVRNVSDRDLEDALGRVYPAGSDTDVSDEWADALLNNPNFESTPKPKQGKATPDKAQEG